MSDFDPVEIEINLKQNVDSEGEKATKSIDDISAASDKMRQQLESNINSQKTIIRQLTSEIESLKKLIESKTNTGDSKLISDKQRLAEEVLRLKSELENAGRAMTELEDKQKTVTNEVVTGAGKMTESIKEFSKEEDIAFQKNIIEGLKSQLSEAEKLFNKFNIGTHDQKTLEQREKLSKVVKELRTELKGEEAALEELEKKTVTTAVKMKSLETRIRETREAMAALKLEGKENTKEYSELEKRLGLLGTAYKEIFNTQKALSTGGSQMEGVLSGMSALSGMLSAGAGAFGLFNSESENFAKIQTKVQSLMAITIGLQQISNTLHATSAFRITTVTKAKQLWATASVRLAAALGISNAAAKVLMATLTLGLSVAITAAMVIIDKFVSRQKKAAEQQKKITEAVSQAAGEQLTSLEKLKKGYESLEGDVKSQTKYLEDNKSEFEKLGVAISGVNDAELLFSNEGTDAFRTAVMERAKSLALMEMAAERYKEIVSKEMKLETMSDTNSVYVSYGLSGGGKEVKVENKKKTRLKKQIEEDLAQWQKMIDEALTHDKNAESAFSGAGLTTFDKDKDKDDKDSQKAEDKIKDASEKLAKMSSDFQGEIDAAVVAAMQEGAAKKEAELKAQYDRQLAIIDQKLKEVADLEKITGKPATEQRSLLKSWADGVKIKYEAELQQLRGVAAAEVGEMWNDIDDRFRTRLDKQLSDINSYYNQRKEELKDHYTDENLIAEAAAELEKKRQKELSLALRNHELERFDFATQIDLRRQQIKNRGILLETQKQENLLKIEKKAAEQRLLKLRELESAGEDVADEIVQVTLDIEEMNAELDAMPVRKLQEALSSLQQIAGTLSGLAGTVGEVFGAVGKAVSNISVSLDESASKMDKIGAGVSSAVDFINMLSAAARERKEAEKEYYQNQIALAHEYALALNDQIRLQSELSGSGFITDYTGSLNDGFNALTDATRGYQDSLRKLSAGKAKTDLKNAVNWGNVGKGAASGAGIGAAVGSVVPVIGTAIGALVGGLVGLVGGLFGGKKKKEMFGGLLDVFPELVDASGNLNKELAQTLISTNQVDDNTKQLLQNSLDWADAVEQAKAQIKEIVTSLAGDLGSSLQSAIVDAWKAGEDASARMFDAASASMEKFIEDLLYSTIFSDVFDEFADRLAASLDPGSGDQDILDDYDWLMGQMEEREGAYTAWMDSVKARAGERGYNMWTPEEQGRQATSKGIAAASQDSIDDLSGRITSIQGIVSDIRAIGRQGFELERERAAFNSMLQGQLDAIADNTYYCRYLEEVSKNLADINTKGVKVRS